MRTPYLLMLTCCCSMNLTGTELPAGILRWIDPEATVVRSVDFERHTRSPLNALFRVNAHETFCRPACPPLPRRVVYVSGIEGGEPWEYEIVEGVPPIPKPPTADPDEEFSFHAVNGYLLADVAVGANLALRGHADRIRKAIERSKASDQKQSELVERIRNLSAQYDNWILAIKPLASFSRERVAAGRLATELIEAVEEVRAGVRFGASNAIGLEIAAKTAEDANGVAALLRWLPGFFELTNSTSFVPPGLLDLMEESRIQVSGATALFSFSLSDASLTEFARKLEEQEKQNQM